MTCNHCSSRSACAYIFFSDRMCKLYSTCGVKYVYLIKKKKKYLKQNTLKQNDNWYYFQKFCFIKWLSRKLKHNDTNDIIIIISSSSSSIYYYYYYMYVGHHNSEE